MERNKQDFLRQVAYTHEQQIKFSFHRRDVQVKIPAEATPLWYHSTIGGSRNRPARYLAIPRIPDQPRPLPRKTDVRKDQGN